MTKRNSSGLRNAGTIATVAALTLGMAGPGVMTATADENTANGNTGTSAAQATQEVKYTTTVAGTPVDFTKDGKGDYTATVPKVKGKFQNQVIVSGTDKSQITLTTSQKPTDGKISGPVVYTSAADSAPKFTLTVTDYEIVDKIVDDQPTQPWNATVDGKKTYPLGVKGDTRLPERHRGIRRQAGPAERIRHRRLQAGRRRDEEHSGIQRDTAVRLHLGQPGDR